MSFDSYVNLQSEIVDYLARSDLNAKIPSFITLCEAKLNRALRVRQMETRAVTAVDTTSDEPEFISLPDDFQSMRRIRLSSVSGRPPLAYLTGEALEDYRTSQGDVGGTPQFYTIIGDELELLPVPDADYTIELTYRTIIPPLASNSTNWLLTLAPDIYLYGALLEAQPYMKNDQRIAVWGAGFTAALDGLNKIGNQAGYGGFAAIAISGPTP